jgi:hypothetical protein
MIKFNARIQGLVDRKRISDIERLAAGCLREEEVQGTVGMEATELGIEEGLRLASKAKGRAIYSASVNEATGTCIFYFVGTAASIAAKLKKLPDNWISEGVEDE